MEAIIEIFKMPIPSMAGLLILWALAERAGLPITRMVSSFLNLNGKDKHGDTNSSTAERFNAIDSQLKKMVVNDISHVHEDVKTNLEKTKTLCQKIDSTNEKLDYLIREGIRIKN